MPTRTIQKTVNANEPVRAGLLNSDTFIAQATPLGAKPTEKENHIIDAYQRGGDLHKIVIAHHTHPATLYRLLGLNPAEHAETYAQLLKTYDDLKARALR